jgi:CRP-like cAMP-binding protein
MNGLMSRQTISKGHLILYPDKICTSISFIKEGTFRTFRLDEKGFERNFLFHFENSFITDYESFLHQKPSEFYIECLAEADILTINYKTIQKLYEEIPGFEKLGRLIAEGLYLSAKRRVEDFMFLNPEERYKKLIRLQPEIFKKIPVGMIAEYINIRPQSLSRIRKRVYI